MKVLLVTITIQTTVLCSACGTTIGSHPDTSTYNHEFYIHNDTVTNTHDSKLITLALDWKGSSLCSALGTRMGLNFLGALSTARYRLSGSRGAASPFALRNSATVRIATQAAGSVVAWAWGVPGGARLRAGLGGGGRG